MLVSLADVVFIKNKNNKMKWTKLRRSSGLLEHVCEHGVGHPDYESAKEVAKHYGHDIGAWLIHGCDGCCKRNDFPDKLKYERQNRTTL